MEDKLLTPRLEASEPAVAPTIRKKYLSWIWLIPVIAAISCLSLLVKTWLQTGPNITIQFTTAQGLEPDKTPLRYKDVVIGMVKSIHLSKDRSHVIVNANLFADAANLATEGAAFWVVRPRLGGSGISGLTTLVSGVYIAVDAPADSSSKQKASKFSFVGLEKPPAVVYNRPGKRYTLNAHDLGSLDIGSPVYYRLIKVGYVVGYHFNQTGQAVHINIFIDQPYDQYVTNAVRFWNISGIDLSVTAEGLKVHTPSLLALAMGGIAFESLGKSSNTDKSDNNSFKLYESETDAKAVPSGESIPIRMRFDQSTRGLNIGATIDFNGINLGTVTAINLDYDPTHKHFFIWVDANLYPQNLGGMYDRRHQNQSGPVRSSTHPTVLETMVQNGLHAQLRTANLLTGQLYVALEMLPTKKKSTVDLSSPLVIPTRAGSLDQMQQQITQIIDKFKKIPFDKLGENLNISLTNASRLMERLDTHVAPKAQEALGQIKQTLQDFSNNFAADTPLTKKTEQAIEEFSRAINSLRALTDFLQRHPEALLRGRISDK